MLVETIVRKTLGLKRHCVKKVIKKDGELLVYLIPNKRYKIICSQCDMQALVMILSRRDSGSMCQYGEFLLNWSISPEGLNVIPVVSKKS
jgi:hypothetical protein